LGYRILDVSTLKEAARRWWKRAYNAAPQKKGLHQAREDIVESIAEAKHYKETLFERPRYDQWMLFGLPMIATMMAVSFLFGRRLR
jgi:oligoribonuclease